MRMSAPSYLPCTNLRLERKCCAGLFGSRQSGGLVSLEMSGTDLSGFLVN